MPGLRYLGLNVPSRQVESGSPVAWSLPIVFWAGPHRQWCLFDGRSIRSLHQCSFSAASNPHKIANSLVAWGSKLSISSHLPCLAAFSS